MPAVVVPPPIHAPPPQVPETSYKPPPTTIPMPSRAPSVAPPTSPTPTPAGFVTSSPTRADGSHGPVTSASRNPVDDAQPTVADVPSDGTDRSGMGWQGQAPLTADAPQLGADSATSVGVPTRPTPGWVWLLTPAIAIGVIGSAAVVRVRADAAPAVPSVTADPEVDPQLLWLADVNESDPARVRPYAERHAALGELEGTARADRIDRRLNVALDLHQAVDSPKPCDVYADALDAVAASPEHYFASALRRSTVPTGDDARCEGLTARRDALLAEVDR